MSEPAPMPYCQFWRFVFHVKGIWNCGFTTVFYFAENPLRDWFGVSHPDPAYRAMFLALAFIFGLGYWRVGQDIGTNRDIVRGGVLGQTAVFLVVANEVILAHRLPLLFIVPATIDLVFAVLFISFLLQTRNTQR